VTILFNIYSKKIQGNSFIELPCLLRLLIMRLPTGNEVYGFCEKIMPYGQDTVRTSVID